MSGPIVANFPEPLVRGRFAAAFAAPGGPGGQELAEGYKRAGQFVREFAANGGKVIAGDDTGAGAGSGTPGLAQHLELRMLVEAGLMPMQAIQSATLWSAEAWGKSKDVGTLEAGKRADLLILNRNPLEDIAATTDIYRVIQGGVVIDRDALAKWQEMLPRPGAIIDPLPGYPNTLMHIPFIDEISPEWLPATRKSWPELIITGENFSNEDLVLINDRLFPAKAEGRDQLRISIPPGFLKKPGTYPLVVVQPGSAGGVSNTFYLTVTAD